MIALIVTLITSALEIADQLLGADLGMTYQEGIEIFLAAITPLLVWLLPHISWIQKFPE